mmetsp:Transcript_16918/g.29737  ORF Transcript_16918/g.29737 Transcript_16918/m.29737 type:complete len:208 (+) Transcript_16918:54-677(+)
MSFQSPLAQAMIQAERQRRRRCADARDVLIKARKTGFLMKARKSSISCFGVPDRFEKNQIVLTDKYLYWTDKIVPGGDHCWSDRDFTGCVSLAVPDCKVALVQGSNTRFMIWQGVMPVVPIIFDAGSQSSRDEWVKQLAAQVKRCQTHAIRNLASGETVEQCAICLGMETGKQGFCRTRCDHDFHKDCLTQWLEKSRACPCCREELI